MLMASQSLQHCSFEVRSLGRYMLGAESLLSCFDCCYRAHGQDFRPPWWSPGASKLIWCFKASKPSKATKIKHKATEHIPHKIPQIFPRTHTSRVDYKLKYNEPKNDSASGAYKDPTEISFANTTLKDHISAQQLSCSC